MDTIKASIDTEKYREYTSETGIELAHAMSAVSGLLAATSLVMSFRSGVGSTMPSVLAGKLADLQDKMSSEFITQKVH